MIEEKDPFDPFDMFREESENLVEQPQAETWQRLEKRLASAQKRRQKRKPVATQGVVLAVMVVLILILGVASWVITKEHESVLRGQKQFAGLRFLEGRWTASEGKIGDEFVFDAQDSTILRGVKTVMFKEALIERESFLIENKGKNTFFTHKNQRYKLKSSDSQTFVFAAADGSVVRLRQSSERRFTLSFDIGKVFVYRKM